MLKFGRIILFSTVSLSSVMLIGCGSYIASGQYQPPPTAHHYVPEGYLPPEGKCRIWYHDRPAKQQPPIGDCHQLQHNVPANARLIKGAS